MRDITTKQVAEAAGLKGHVLDRDLGLGLCDRIRVDGKPCTMHAVEIRRGVRQCRQHRRMRGPV